MCISIYRPYYSCSFLLVLLLLASLQLLICCVTLGWRATTTRLCFYRRIKFALDVSYISCVAIRQISSNVYKIICLFLQAISSTCRKGVQSPDACSFVLAPVINLKQLLEFSARARPMHHLTACRWVVHSRSNFQFSDPSDFLIRPKPVVIRRVSLFIVWGRNWHKNWKCKTHIHWSLTVLNVSVEGA